jgi:addiction module RelE/StbE family toxin
MVIQYLSSFKKQYQKLAPKLQQQFHLRLLQLLNNPTDPRLRIHPLKGTYAGYWSMNVTGDVRAIYLLRGDDVIIFALIGTHSELYG